MVSSSDFVVFLRSPSKARLFSQGHLEDLEFSLCDYLHLIFFSKYGSEGLLSLLLPQVPALSPGSHGATVTGR